MWFYKKFFIAAIITFQIEIRLLFFILKHFYKNKGVKFSTILFSGIFSSGFTLPYLWFLLPIIVTGKFTIIIGESLVILTEAIIYKFLLPINYKKSFLLSLILNASSYFLGTLLLNRFLYFLY
jgi:hypothetical protein